MKNFASEFNTLSYIINNAKNVLLFAHSNPDGDTAGSVLAFKEYLELYPNEKLQLTSKETINKRNNSRKYGKPKIIEKLCICGCNKVFKCKEDSRQKYIRGHNKGRKGKGPTKGTYQKGHLVLNITKNKQSKATRYFRV